MSVTKIELEIDPSYGVEEYFVSCLCGLGASLPQLYSEIQYSFGLPLEVSSISSQILSVDSSFHSLVY